MEWLVQLLDKTASAVFAVLIMLIRIQGFFLKCEFHPIDLFFKPPSQFQSLLPSSFQSCHSSLFQIWLLSSPAVVNQVGLYKASWLALKRARLWIRLYITVLHSLSSSSIVHYNGSAIRQFPHLMCYWQAPTSVSVFHLLPLQQYLYVLLTAWSTSLHGGLELNDTV